MSSSSRRSSRPWMQRFSSALGMGGNQQNQNPAATAGANVGGGQNFSPSGGGAGNAQQDENAMMGNDDNITPSPRTLQDLKAKEYRVKLTQIFNGLAMARKSYLNHADENWQTFLDRVQEAYEFFEGGKTPERNYRDSFTIENYRMLFQRENFAYRDDVCRGVKRIRDGMWVNGEEVKFPQSLVDEGFELASRGEKLMDVVFMIDDMELNRSMEQVHPTTRAVAVEKFKIALRMFDTKYVIFEKNYIEALIAVEKRSRNLVETIAKQIVTLAESGEKVNQELLDHMAELNKKSRDCFNCRYDYNIMRTVLTKSYEASIHERLWYLPTELIERFDDICAYLKELQPKILRVHPKLEHNPGLVQRLEKFHDTYGRVCDWVNNGENPMSQFCQFLDEVLPTKNIQLDGSVDSILLIPRLFCLFAWKHRVQLLDPEIDVLSPVLGAVKNKQEQTVLDTDEPMKQQLQHDFATATTVVTRKNRCDSAAMSVDFEQDQNMDPASPISTTAEEMSVSVGETTNENNSASSGSSASSSSPQDQHHVNHTTTQPAVVVPVSKGPLEYIQEMMTGAMGNSSGSSGSNSDASCNYQDQQVLPEDHGWTVVNGNTNTGGQEQQQQQTSSSQTLNSSTTPNSSPDVKMSKSSSTASSTSNYTKPTRAMIRALKRLITELQPELLVDLSRSLCRDDRMQWETASMQDLVQEIILNGIDSPTPSDLSKEWEVHSIQLQRHNASAWNAFVSVILHEDPDEEERRARPRLPSV
ncbi:unnamed protein product [Amoebophrya sp. A120]|nr:unnamed protein product [Amoebophrya sp. A120]|eukprot:GSA120T00008031001.1